MKLHKLLLWSGAMMVAALGITGCDDVKEPDYQPAESVADAQACFSVTDNGQTIYLGGAQTSVQIPIYRNSDQGTLTVQLTSDSDPSVFSVPDSYTFTDGQKDGTVVVPCNMDVMTPGEDYNLAVTIAGLADTPYYLGTFHAIAKTIPWRNLRDDGALDTSKGGNFNCNFLGIPFGMTDVITWPVEMYEREDIPGIYRFTDPWANGQRPVLEEGDFLPDPNRYMYLNCTNPSEVYLCDINGNPQDSYMMGASYNVTAYGYMTTYCVASECLNGNDPDGSHGLDPKAYYGKVNKGVITFPAKAFVCDFQIDGLPNRGYNWTKANKQSLTIELPGYEDKDPTKVWNNIGEGTFTEYWAQAMMGEDPVTETVRYQENAGIPGWYRAVDPYYTIYQVGSGNIEIDATVPACVRMNLQSTGVEVNEGAGALSIANYAGFCNLYAAPGSQNYQTVEQLIAAGAADTMDDQNVITFKVGHLVAAEGSNLFFIDQKSDKEIQFVIPTATAPAAAPRSFRQVLGSKYDGLRNVVNSRQKTQYIRMVINQHR